MKDRLGKSDLITISRKMKEDISKDLVALLESNGLNHATIEYTVTKLKAIDFVIGSLIGLLDEAERQKELV